MGFVRQAGDPNRKGYKTGYQVVHEFVVTQGAKSVDCLYRMQNYFMGQVVVNHRYANHKEPMYRYVVRKRHDLLRVIVSFFTCPATYGNTT